MPARFQRLIGVGTNILAITLLIVSVSWLVNHRRSPWKFVPEQHTELHLTAGTVEFEISFERLAYCSLALAIVLICFGTFLIWRARSNRLR